MFIAAKVLAFLTQPLAWVALLIALALLFSSRAPRRSARLLGLALALLLLAGWKPLPDALLRRLETRYPVLADSPALDAYAGVIVLGGALEPAYVWTSTGTQSALNEAAERMTEALALARHHPKLKVLFTGGEGQLFSDGPSEAQRARRFFESQGLAPQQLLFEGASRTTYENALLSRQLAGVNPSQPWLLLTSAWHMPRAMATFRKTGWNVTAYPVDFRTGTYTPWSEYQMDDGVARWRLLLHEWLGLLMYSVSGRA